MTYFSFKKHSLCHVNVTKSTFLTLFGQNSFVFEKKAVTLRRFIVPLFLRVRTGEKRRKERYDAERYSIHIVQHSRAFGEGASSRPGGNSLDDAEGYV